MSTGVQHNKSIEFAVKITNQFLYTSNENLELPVPSLLFVDTVLTNVTGISTRPELDQMTACNAIFIVSVEHECSQYAKPKYII